MSSTRLFVRSTFALMFVAGAALAQNAAPPAQPAKPATPAAPAQPATPATPATPKSDEKLPSGKDVLAKYVEATGGRAAYEKIKTRVSEGSFEMKPMGVMGTMKLVQQAPAMMSLTLDIESIGAIVQGNNGTHAWMSNPIQGTRLLDGDELEESNRQAQLAAELNPDIVYKSVECVGVEKVGEIECYKVELVTKGDSKRSAFYGKQDGLLHRLDMTVKSPAGEAKASNLLEDYRDIDGVKVPFKVTMAVSAGVKIEQVMTFSKISHNAEVPADSFTPPKEVQELIDAKKKAAEKPAEPKKSEDKKPEEKKVEPKAEPKK
ncbi:MAG: hypothetical protein HEQ23_04950 [Tepidisphaera sp.]|jgi:outer membrane biosynthesis protein TonB